MCGILGVINGEASFSGITKVCDYMQQGAIVGVLRGVDSTGMMQITKDHGVRVHKLPVDGGTFSTTKRAQAMFRMADSSLATILHHRAATNGEVSYENCHPFDHETADGKYVIGVHNGTVSSWNKKEDGLTFEVDSDWLYYQITKHGAKQALEDIRGAYALVWYDAELKQMRIARNSQRELHFAYIKNKNTMIIASEAPMLYWLARRNDIEIEKVLYPEVNTIYSFPFTDLRKFTQIKLEEKNFPLVHMPRQGTSKNTRRGKTQTTTTDSTGKQFKDMFGAVAADRLGTFNLKLGSEVEVFFDGDKINLDGPQDIDVEFFDEESTGEIHCGTIANVSGSQLYNMARASSCISRAIGIRQFYDEGVPNGMEVLFAWPSTIKYVSKSSNEMLVEGPNGTKLTRGGFDMLTKDGCAYCKGSVEFSDAYKGRIDWVGVAPVCAVCNNASIPVTEKGAA